MSDDTDSSTSSGAPEECVVEGRGVAAGIALGTLYRYDPGAPDLTRDTISEDEVEQELALFSDAVERAEQEIRQVHAIARGTLGEENAAIFEAQRMMLKDQKGLLEPVRTRIRRQQESAGSALKTVLRRSKHRLDEAEDGYFRDRTDDLLEVETRLLRALEQGKTAARIEPNAIVVADTLTTSDLIRLNEHGMLGCVTARGGPTSHVSILARALGVPAVVGANSALEAGTTHDSAILDGHAGRLIVHPSADTLSTYRRRRAQQQSLRAEQSRSAAAPAATTDGRAITVQANVEFSEELQILEEYGAEGIGLLRTELLFLSRPSGSLSEEEQVALYRSAAQATGSHGATVRLLDLGGDKALPQSPNETNPSLGWRGIRLLLDRPEEWLRPQVRALLRANASGTLRVLLPMVTALGEIRRVRTIIQEEADRLSERGVEHNRDLPLGTMVEVPATALQAHKFAEAADFLSIGTNDLTQYVLAVDRNNDRVASRYDSLHPAVLQLVQRTATAGTETDTPVAVCGESASDIQAIPLLIGLGVSVLSATPSTLPAVKHLIRNISYADAQALASDACDLPDAAAVRRRVQDWLAHRVDLSAVEGPWTAP